MGRNLLALIAGPLVLIALAIVFFGSFGLIYGMFIVGAACIYIPLLLLGVSILGFTLPAILFVANLIPLGFCLAQLVGGTRIEGIAQLAPWLFGAANFCAMVYWAIAKKKASKPPDRTLQLLRERGDL